MTTATVPDIEEGVLALTAAEYHAPSEAPRALSFSGAKLLLPPSCPALFRYAMTHPREHKPAYDFGHVAHALVLGAGERIEVIDANDWKLKATREKRDAAYAAGLTPILADDYMRARDMAGAISSHPVAGELFRPGTGLPEQSLFWVDQESGVRRRSMVDWLPDPVTGCRTDAGGIICPDLKGLALDTPIPTPSGWASMRDLVIGDLVFGSDGRPCTVTNKSHVRYDRCYRIKFDDKSTVICDAHHLWKTTRTVTSTRRATEVLTAEQIKESLKRYGQCHHKIPISTPLQLPDKVLPVHPYVLGCWLGDGTAREGQISKPDTELFDRIERCGYRVAPIRLSDKCPTRTVYGLRTQLRKMGLLGHKVVPDCYLRASYAQRLALLRGLMDTDGTWNRPRRQAVFTSTDKALSESVRELACSLGQRAVIHQVAQHGFGLTVTAYPVSFTPLNGMNPFSLSRKADLVWSVYKSPTYSSRRLIVAVEEIPTVPTQCITVDSSDSTYLCTESMIPTHNTTESAEPGNLARHIYQFCYHMQGAYYLDGITALGLSPDGEPAFVLVFVEKSPPHLITIVQMTPEDLQWGRVLNRKAIDIYRRCCETDTWPGYPGTESVISVPLPYWAVRQYETAWERGDYDLGTVLP